MGITGRYIICKGSLYYPDVDGDVIGTEEDIDATRMHANQFNGFEEGQFVRIIDTVMCDVTTIEWNWRDTGVIEHTKSY